MDIQLAKIFNELTSGRQDNLSELRKARVLQELNNELENGTITIEQFNELREELFKIESIEKDKITDLNLDNVEKIIKMKKKLND